jgi:hypothetical protein
MAAVVLEVETPEEREANAVLKEFWEDVFHGRPLLRWALERDGGGVDRLAWAWPRASDPEWLCLIAEHVGCVLPGSYCGPCEHEESPSKWFRNCRACCAVVRRTVPALTLAFVLEVCG